MAYFTQQQIEEIRQRLATRAVKDSQFPTASVIKLEDFVAIVQSGVNKKITISGMYANIAEYIQDNYLILVDVLCKNGSTMMRTGMTSDIQACVLLGYEDVTDRLPRSAFSWERSSGDEGADEAWTYNHRQYGPTVHITRDDINGACTFYCYIPIEAIRNLE